MNNRRSGSDDHEVRFDVAAGGVGIGADLFVRLRRQGREIRLRKGFVLDVQLDREAEAAALAGPDRHRTLDLRIGRVLAVLLGDEIERAAEAGGVIPTCVDNDSL